MCFHIKLKRPELEFGRTRMLKNDDLLTSVPIKISSYFPAFLFTFYKISITQHSFHRPTSMFTKGYVNIHVAVTSPQFCKKKKNAAVRLGFTQAFKFFKLPVRFAFLFLKSNYRDKICVILITSRLFIHF